MSSDDINSPTREALDRVGGAAKKVLGTVTGNADLLEEGQLQSVAAGGAEEPRRRPDRSCDPLGSWIPATGSHC
jgi:uncharacterized protein YjbJ (UPF0337 family)